MWLLETTFSSDLSSCLNNSDVLFISPNACFSTTKVMPSSITAKLPLMRMLLLCSCHTDRFCIDISKRSLRTKTPAHHVRYAHFLAFSRWVIQAMLALNGRSAVVVSKCGKIYKCVWRGSLALYLDDLFMLRFSYDWGLAFPVLCESFEPLQRRELPQFVACFANPSLDVRCDMFERFTACR